MKELTNESFVQIIASSAPVAVDFWADWCMPCKMYAPVLEELAKELDGKAEICKLNVDDCRETAVEFGVTNIPTVIIFKNGKEVGRQVGVLPKSDLREAIESHL